MYRHCTLAIRAGLIQPVHWPPPWPSSLIVTSEEGGRLWLVNSVNSCWVSPTGSNYVFSLKFYFHNKLWMLYSEVNKGIWLHVRNIDTQSLTRCMPSHLFSRTTHGDESFQKLLCLIYCGNNSEIGKKCASLVCTRAWSPAVARSAGLYSPGECLKNACISIIINFYFTLTFWLNVSHIL